MAKFKKIETLTMRMFKAARGKCPYCGVVTKATDKKRKCKHLKSMAPTSEMVGDQLVLDGKAIFKFERPIKPLTFTREGRKLHTAMMKQTRKKLLAKAKQEDPEVAQYKQAVVQDKDLVKQYLQQAGQRGTRSAKSFVSHEGIEEYLAPKYKRQLTILKSIKGTPAWRAMDRVEKKILKGKIRNLGNKIREARKKQKLERKMEKHALKAQGKKLKLTKSEEAKRIKRRARAKERRRLRRLARGN